jgi:hypothetical protein
METYPSDVHMTFHDSTKHLQGHRGLLFEPMVHAAPSRKPRALKHFLEIDPMFRTGNHGFSKMDVSLP